MSYISWTPGLSVGVAAFDKDHQKLISLVNQLHDAMRAGKSRDVLGPILKELVSYTQQHFVREEQLMQQHGYPALRAHKAEHEKLVAQVGKHAADFEAGNLALGIELMQFLKDWLTNHIQRTDQQYGAHFKAHGVA